MAALTREAGTLAFAPSSVALRKVRENISQEQ